jgi:hypothetical protein
LSYFDPFDSHDTNVKENYANLVFDFDTAVMKNDNDLNQSNKDSFLVVMKIESIFADVYLDFIRKYNIHLHSEQNRIVLGKTLLN